MIEKISIFVSDLDGTLTKDGGALMPITKAALQHLHEDGVLIGIASGRPLDRPNIINKSKEWDLGFDFDFALGMNGGDLWTKEADEIEHFYQLSAEIVRKIVTFLMPFDCNIIEYEKAYELVRAKREDHFTQMTRERSHSQISFGDIDFLSENPTGKIEVQFHPRYEEEFMKLVKENQSPDWTTTVTYRGESIITIEFLDPRVDKGLGIEMYARRKDIPLAECISFGDLENDIALLERTGWGVCLLNGSDLTKAAAQDVTEYDVENDGVGRYLEEHWFGRH